MQTGALATVLIAATLSAYAAGMPGNDPDELWTFITKTDNYRTWCPWSDHRGIHPGSSPHGATHRVFVNRPGQMSTQVPARNGTIVVKENFDREGALTAVTVMFKSKGYNPEAGDWYWAKYSPDGKVDKAGKPAGCIGCHAARADNDYIMLHEF